jgi:hypothetical protein
VILVSKNKPTDIRFVCRIIIVAVSFVLLVAALFELNGTARLLAPLGIGALAFALVILVDWLLRKRTYM